MSLHIGFVSQTGAGAKDQKSKTDSDGNRVFSVYTHDGNDRYPLLKEGSDDEPKLFRGKTPQTVAKKVVTEICQLIKKQDPNHFKKKCAPVTSAEIRLREKELESIKDPRAVSKISLEYYPGFEFDLEDTMNSTSDGKLRVYKYYGERVKLDSPKKYNQNKFQIEPNVIPIRKNYTLKQAFLDHLKKSKRASEREKYNQNLSKSRKISRGPSRRLSRQRSETKKREAAKSVAKKKVSVTKQ